jgi:hypothetical protein
LKHVHAVYDRTSVEDVRAKRQSLEVYASINNALIEAGKLLEQAREVRDPKNNKVIGNIFFSAKHKPTPEIIAEGLSKNLRSLKSFCLELSTIRINSQPLKTSSAPCLFLMYWQIDLRIGEIIKTLSYAPGSWAIVGDKDRFKTLKQLIENKFPLVTVDTSTPIIPIQAGNHYRSYLNKFPLSSIIETASYELDSHQVQFDQLQIAIESCQDPETKESHLSKQRKIGVIIRKYEDFLNHAPTFQNTAGYISGRVAGKPNVVKEVYFNIASKQLPWTMDLINSIHEQTTNIVVMSDEINELEDEYVIYSPLNLNIYREKLDSGYSVTNCKLSIRVARFDNGIKKIINIFMTPNVEVSKRYSVDFKPVGSADLISISGSTIIEILNQVNSFKNIDELHMDDDSIMEDQAVADFFVETVDVGIEAEMEVTA